MSRGLDVEAFRARAERTLRDSDIAEAHARFRNLVGPLPEEMTDLAREAYDALREGQAPSEQALHALELAIRMHRPAVLVRHAVLGALPKEAVAAFPQWEAFVTAVRGHVSAIGCVEHVDGGAELVGTCFAIGPEAVVTNRHVVDVLTGGSRSIAPRSAQARFGDSSCSAAGGPAVPIVEIIAQHDALDLAVLRIEPDASPPTPFTVSEEAPEVGLGVVAIGYPADDPRSAGFDDLLFADGLGVKRAAPGEITGTRRAAFFHDCSTLGGSSGSPVLSLEDASLVGVHSDGYFLARNEGVSAASAVEFLAANRG